MPDSDGDWYRAAISLHVQLFGIDGHPRDLADIVKDALSKLAKVADEDERRRLEYTLLGIAMPLGARRAFEEYCVCPTSGTSPH